jgi:outer membrane protein OmpA-like peptidoglycan-associated protein
MENQINNNSVTGKLVRMKKIALLLSLTASFILFSQGIKAQYGLRQADEQYNLLNYSRAAELYLKVYKKKATLYTAERLAACYNQMNDYQNQEIWCAKTVAMAGATAADILNYAKALQSNAKYNEAKVQFNRYYSLSTGIQKERAKLWIASCDSALVWMKKPVIVEIRNVPELNSQQSDWGAVAYNKGIVFTSDRVDDTGHTTVKKKPFLYFDRINARDKKIYGWTGNSYLKLFYLSFDKFKKDSVDLFPLDAGTDYHIGSASFTADGNEMYFTVTRAPKKVKADTQKIKTINLEIYSSGKDPVTNKWEQPVPFKYNNAKVWSVGDPFISPDGKTLYFTADFSWGLGGTDIYYCVMNDAGEWDKPINLQEVNTRGNERTPVLDSKGNLYFSSDGGIGMGGLDIYKAIRYRRTFKPPQNLGFPINSPRDDFSYVITNGTSGYFASNREGGLGEDDIYSFNTKAELAGGEKPALELKLEGIVYEKTNNVPLTHNIVILATPLAEDVVKLTDSAGKYKFDLPENKDFKLTAEKAGYLTDIEHITTKGLTTSQTLKQDFYLQKIQLNKGIRIENIYYDFDKYNIRRDAAIELNKLIKILKDNPNIYIELGSHTDSRGSDKYNNRLSQRRANSCVAYLIKVGGIDKNRLTSRGYGKTQLLNRCSHGVHCTEKEHQVNRRTEFKIIKM